MHTHHSTKHFTSQQFAAQILPAICSTKMCKVRWILTIRAADGTRNSVIDNHNQILHSL